MKRCPTCDSPAPNRHPSVQYGGETEPCIDPFHDADDRQSGWLKAYIAEKRSPLTGAKAIASVRPARPFGGESAS